MTVYLVTTQEPDSEILGIYSSRERAEYAAVQHVQAISRDLYLRIGLRDIDIKAVTVDAGA